MRLSSALLAASCGLAAAHGDLPIPRIVGGRKFMSEMKSRHISGLPKPRAPPVEHVHAETRTKAEKRQSNKDGSCGKGVGSCAVGYCCSSEGYDDPFSRLSKKICI